jgi:hypothetical protein
MRGKRRTIPMGYALRRPRLLGRGGKLAVECVATLDTFHFPLTLSSHFQVRFLSVRDAYCSEVMPI